MTNQAVPDSTGAPANSHDRGWWIPWLADAPMFIDGPQVAAFYDAVLRPRYKTTQLTISQEQVTDLEKSISGKAEFSLSSLFPWLTASVGGEAGRVRKWGRKRAQDVTLEPIENPARQLVELSLHYLDKQPERIWAPRGADWAPPSDAIVAEAPRMLAFIEFPPTTKFVPMAAELDSGKVETLFDKVQAKAGPNVPALPPYPENPTTPEGKAEATAYWKWFSEHWSAKSANDVVEEGVGSSGRPQWVAYRASVNGSESLHLNVVGHGDVDTGVFAYNLVKRGWENGVRVIGRVRGGQSINVLAMYDM